MVRNSKKINNERGKRLKRGYKRPTSASDFGITKYIRLEDDVEYGIVDIVTVKGYEYYFLIKENDLEDMCIRKSIDKDGQSYLVGLADNEEFGRVLCYIYDPTRCKSYEMKRVMEYWINGNVVVKKTRIFTIRFILFLVALSIITYSISFFISYYVSFGELFFPSANTRPDNALVDTDGCLIEANIDTLRLLNEAYWVELSLHERLDVLQCAINIEATYRGFPEAPTLRTGVLKEGVVGDYNHRTRTIRISVDYLMSEKIDGFNSLEVVLHEVFHSYQYWLVEAFNTLDDKYKELFIFQHIVVYEMEIRSLESGNSTCFWSTLEMHADSFAARTTDEYMEIIDALINNDS